MKTDSAGSACEGDPRALCGWSPRDLAADTTIKRIVDRVVPRSGLGVCLYFIAVIGLLVLAPRFARPIELSLDGLAALAAGGWCALNFWRCRQAHCLVTAVGWLPLAMLSFVEAGIGRSLIAGDEQLVFVAVLALGLAFEAGWWLRRRTRALSLMPRGSAGSTLL